MASMCQNISVAVLTSSVAASDRCAPAALSYLREEAHLETQPKTLRWPGPDGNLQDAQCEGKKSSIRVGVTALESYRLPSLGRDEVAISENLNFRSALGLLDFWAAEPVGRRAAPPMSKGRGGRARTFERLIFVPIPVGDL